MSLSSADSMIQPHARATFHLPPPGGWRGIQGATGRVDPTDLRVLPAHWAIESRIESFDVTVLSVASLANP